MRAFLLALAALAAPILAAPSPQGPGDKAAPPGDKATPPGTPGPDKDGKYTISSDKLRIQFIPYGAAITNLFLKSKKGEELDVILGWDNATFYSTTKV
jgi:hypothetical protein